VSLEHPIPGLKDRVMNAIKPWWNSSQLFAIETELKQNEDARVLEPTATHELNPLEAYKAFYNETRQQELPSDLEHAFLELLGDSHEQQT
jgi:hypothetical protein